MSFRTLSDDITGMIDDGIVVGKSKLGDGARVRSLRRPHPEVGSQSCLNL